MSPGNAEYGQPPQGQAIFTDDVSLQIFMEVSQRDLIFGVSAGCNSTAVLTRLFCAPVCLFFTRSISKSRISLSPAFLSHSRLCQY